MFLLLYSFIKNYCPDYVDYTMNLACSNIFKRTLKKYFYCMYVWKNQQIFASEILILYNKTCCRKIHRLQKLLQTQPKYFASLGFCQLVHFYGLNDQREFIESNNFTKNINHRKTIVHYIYDIMTIYDINS